MTTVPPAAGAAPANAIVILLDSLNRHMLGAYGGARVRDAEPRPLARRARALHRPLRRLAALHAGAPRHPVRRARLPLAAVGLDRDLGGADHRPPARGRAS